MLLMTNISGPSIVYAVTDYVANSRYRILFIKVSFSDGDQHGLIGVDFTQPLQHKLKDLGYNLIKTPYKEFHKSGGSIRCSVLDIGI